MINFDAHNVHVIHTCMMIIIIVWKHEKYFALFASKYFTFNKIVDNQNIRFSLLLSKYKSWFGYTFRSEMSKLHTFIMMGRGQDTLMAT